MGSSRSLLLPIPNFFWRRSCHIARKTSEGTSSFTQSLPPPPLDGASVELVPRTARVYRESLRCQQCEHKRLLISDKRRISRARFENKFLLFSIPQSFYCISKGIHKLRLNIHFPDFFKQIFKQKFKQKFKQIF